MRKLVQQRIPSIDELMVRGDAAIGGLRELVTAMQLHAVSLRRRRRKFAVPAVARVVAGDESGGR